MAEGFRAARTLPPVVPMVATVPERSARSQPSRLGRIPRVRRSAPGGLAVVLGVSLILSVAYFHGAWGSADTWDGILGDPEQMMWFLAWVPHALLHLHTPLVGAEALVPQRENLMWNTSILLPGLLLSPLTLLAGPMTSYNLLVVLAPVFTAGTAYLLMRRYVRSTVAAIAGGLSFGFCPFLIIQTTSHPQLFLLALVPLIVLVFDEIVVRQRWRWWMSGGALGVLAAAQLLTGEEMLAIVALAGGCALVALAGLHPRRVAAKLPYLLRALSTSAVAFVVLAGWPLAVQYRGPQRAPNTHGAAGIRIYVTDLFNFVQPAGQRFGVNVVRHPLAFSGGPTEWLGYLGVPVILLIIWVSVREFRRGVVPVTLLVMLAFAVFSLGPQLHIDGHPSITLPWSILARVPPLDNVLPARLSVIVDLGAAIMVAVFVDRLGGADRRAGGDRLGGSDRPSGADRLGGSVRRAVGDRLGGSDRPSGADRLGGSVRPVYSTGIGAHSPAPRHRHKRPRPARTLGFATGVLLLVLVALSWVPSAGPVTAIAVPRFFTTQERQVLPVGSVALVAPYVDGPNQETAMEWQAASGFRFRMVDGWVIVPGSHFGPRTVAATTLLALEQRPVTVTPRLRAQLGAYLQRVHVHEVLVGPGPGRRRVEGFFEAFFGRRPDVRAGGVSLWWVRPG